MLDKETLEKARAIWRESTRQLDEKTNTDRAPVGRDSLPGSETADENIQARPKPRFESYPDGARRRYNLVIPFGSSEKYHWWAGGQTILDTATELVLSEILDRKLCNLRRGKMSDSAARFQDCNAMTHGAEMSVNKQGAVPAKELPGDIPNGGVVLPTPKNEPKTVAVVRPPKLSEDELRRW